MTARTDRSRTVEQPSAPVHWRTITRLRVIMKLTRLDLAHVGTAEQRLGLTLGTVLIYMRAG